MCGLVSFPEPMRMSCAHHAAAHPQEKLMARCREPDKYSPKSGRDASTPQSSFEDTAIYSEQDVASCFISYQHLCCGDTQHAQV